MKISFINSICVVNDAISKAIRDEVTWMASVPGNEVKLFTSVCDFNDLPVVQVKDTTDVLFHPFFQQSNLIIFHFGVFYNLFNILIISPKSAVKVVVFHNITPKEYLPVEYHELVDSSYKQIKNIYYADYVICDSKENESFLLLQGIKKTSEIIPLALNNISNIPNCKISFEDGVIRLLFIGRYVQSKGPMDLINAIHYIYSKNNELKLEVNFVGNIKFSDLNLVEKIKLEIINCQNKYKDKITIKLHESVSEDFKNKLLYEADIFILPSKHEGFCVPILEALKNGCCIVSYNNSNIINISDKFAKLVETGNVEKLAVAIIETISKVSSFNWIKESGYLYYREEVEKYCYQFYPENIKNQYLKYMKNITLK